MNQSPGDLCRSAIVALLFCIGCFDVARSAGAGDTQIWFGMGALTSPAGRHSWELLYFQPRPAWPDALTKVRPVLQSSKNLQDDVGLRKSRSSFRCQADEAG